MITVDDNSTDWAASELLNAANLAERLLISLATLDAWSTANKVIASRNDAGEYMYPSRQFERNELVAGLVQVAAFFLTGRRVGIARHVLSIHQRRGSARPAVFGARRRGRPSCGRLERLPVRLVSQAEE